MALRGRAAAPGVPLTEGQAGARPWRGGLAPVASWPRASYACPMSARRGRRAALAAVAVLVVVGGAAPAAEATCGICCDDQAQLVGWSEDGKTWAVIATYDTDDQQLVVRTATGILATYGEGGECGGDGLPVELEASKKYTAIQRIDVERYEPLRKYALQRVSGTWRKEFKAKLEVVSGPKRKFRDKDVSFAYIDEGGAECSTWQIRRKGDETPLQVFPQDCEMDNTSLGSVSVRGGYLHPSGKYALVKLYTSSERMTSSEHFLFVDLTKTVRRAKPPKRGVE